MLKVAFATLLFLVSPIAAARSGRGQYRVAGVLLAVACSSTVAFSCSYKMFENAIPGLDPERSQFLEGMNLQSRASKPFVWATFGSAVGLFLLSVVPGRKDPEVMNCATSRADRSKNSE